jgi:hypothetical protein
MYPLFPLVRLLIENPHLNIDVDPFKALNIVADACGARGATHTIFCAKETIYHRDWALKNNLVYGFVFDATCQ